MSTQADDSFQFLQIHKRAHWLLWIHRVAELADQICSLDQLWLQSNGFGRLIYAFREAGEFDCPGDALRIHKGRLSEPLHRKHFRSVHMIRRECSIRCSTNERYLLLLLVDHKFGFGVSTQNTSDVSDVMQQAGRDEMAIVVGFNSMDSERPWRMSRPTNVTRNVCSRL